MKLKFHTDLIARTPALSLEELFNTGLEEILINPQFREAVYIASPELSSQIFDNQDDLSDELKLVVWKYFNRMCFRCTPYGMFAGCGKVSWGNKTLVIRTDDDLRRRTRLDKEYFDALVKKLEIEKGLFFKLKLSLNNTLYQVGDQVRMIELSTGQMDYQITGFPSNPIIQVLLTEYADKSFYAQEILDRGMALGFTGKALKSYLLLLFSDGVIKTELNVLLTANELLNHYIKTLAKLKPDKQTQNWLSMLKEVQCQLSLIDRCENSGFEKYQLLMNNLGSLLPTHPVKKTLQVDHTHIPKGSEVDSGLEKSLLKAVKVLSKINTSPKSNGNLIHFRDAFVARYETREIPILVALDPEIGIGYTKQQTFDSFLLNELSYQHIPEFNNVHISQYSRLQKLITAFHQSIANQNHELILETANFDLLQENPVKLPATSSIFFSQIDQNQLLIKSVSGSSGVNLFSRFVDFDTGLNSLAAQIAQIDQESTDTILAEVIHEPFLRSGNILPQTDFRSYQIPYGSQVVHGGQTPIPLSDIVVGIDRGRIYMRSKKLDRLIRPMISHAFNYQKSSPLYRFLADLQFQDTDTLCFDFPSLVPDQLFYPRLTYQNLIFSAATWFIKLNEAPFIDKAGAIDSFREFLARKKVPALFLICEGDNELLIDQKHPELMLVAIDMLKKRKQLMVKEFIHQPNFRGFQNSKNETFSNELIAVIVNRDQIQINPVSMPPFGLEPGLKREFSFGSEWIYFKLYGGQMNLEQILVQDIFPLLKDLKSKKLMADFFFIRYYDPRFHIRLRLKIQDRLNLTKVTMALQDCFHRLELRGQIWKIQIDTYVRELERYGNSISETESIFCLDSYTVLQLLRSAEIKDNPEKRIAMGIRMIADLIELMTADLDEAIAYSKRIRDSLKDERRIGYPVEKRVRLLFDKNDQLFAGFLNPITNKKNSAVLLERKEIIKKKLEELHRRYPDNYTNDRGRLLIAYVHMSVNRFFSNDQKFYEYLIYNYLFRYFNKLKNSPLMKENSMPDVAAILKPNEIS